jgi:hypothetical protein
VDATILKTVLLSVCLPCLLLATARFASSTGPDAEEGPHASESTGRSAAIDAVVFPSSNLVLPIRRTRSVAES